MGLAFFFQPGRCPALFAHPRVDPLGLRAYPGGLTRLGCGLQPPLRARVAASGRDASRLPSNARLKWLGGEHGRGCPAWAAFGGYIRASLRKGRRERSPRLRMARSGRRVHTSRQRRVHGSRMTRGNNAGRSGQYAMDGIGATQGINRVDKVVPNQCFVWPA